MPDLTTRTLVWLTYRLGATIALGLPLVLLIWAGLRRDPALVRLLSIYWKVASLLAISVLLLTDQRPIGYVTALLAPLLMAGSVWFWVDLNEELADSPPGSGFADDRPHLALVSDTVFRFCCRDVGVSTGLCPCTSIR